MSYREVTLPVTEDQAEVLSDALMELGALSVSVETGPAHTVSLSAPPLPVATQVVDWGLPEATGTLPVPRMELVEDPAVYAADSPYPSVLAAEIGRASCRERV